MANHEKVFGICENKCLVEVSPKSDTDAVGNRVGTLETKNTQHESRISAIESKNTRQDTAIASKQDKLPNGKAGQVWMSDGAGGGYWATIWTVAPVNNLKITFKYSYLRQGSYDTHRYFLKALTFDTYTSGTFSDATLTIITGVSSYSGVKEIGSSEYNTVETGGTSHTIVIPASILNQRGGSSNVFCQSYDDTTSSLFGFHVSKLSNYPNIKSATLTLSTGEVYQATITFED